MFDIFKSFLNSFGVRIVDPSEKVVTTTPKPATIVVANNATSTVVAKTNYNDKNFYDTIRKPLFSNSLSASQVNGLNIILNYWRGNFADGDIRWLAYVLATAYHETARTMQPIAEYGKGKGRDYGVKDRNGQIAYGRGLIQLTWANNYEKADKAIGLKGALIKNYDLALDSEIATKIIFKGMIEGWFTTKKLSDYFNSKIGDPVNARKIVNGTDKSQLIATYYATFLKALKA